MTKVFNCIVFYKRNLHNVLFYYPTSVVVVNIMAYFRTGGGGRGGLSPMWFMPRRDTYFYYTYGAEEFYNTLGYSHSSDTDTAELLLCHVALGSSTVGRSPCQRVRVRQELISVPSINYTTCSTTLLRVLSAIKYNI